MKDFKSVAKAIGHHTRILFKGFTRVLYGTAVAGTFAMAAYGFVSVPSEGGYIAVCDFIVAIATTCVALCCMYALGGSKKKGDKR